MSRATWLADDLRAAGLTVKESSGWQSRGRPFGDLRAVVWHHDASPPGDSPGVPAYMLREMAAGRAGAQLWVDRRGTWYVLASGVAFHAGKVLPGMPGNSQSLGVETDHTTGEAWPEPQLVSLRRGTAVILRRLGRDATALHMHKTICAPPGRKVDPDGLSLPHERGRVAVLMAIKAAAGAAVQAATEPSPAPAPTTPEDDDMAFLFIHDNAWWLRDSGHTVHVPTMEDVRALLALGAVDASKQFSLAFCARLTEGASR